MVDISNNEPSYISLKSILSVGAITGALFGLYLSNQVLVLNGRFGLNRDTILLSLYSITLSVLLFTLLAAVICWLLTQIENITSISTPKRTTAFLILLILPSIFITVSSFQWKRAEGDEALIFSLLAALFSISIVGISIVLFKFLSRTAAMNKKMIFLTIIILGIFFSSHYYYEKIWIFTFDPDFALAPSVKSERKAIIIGLDSANWHVMDRLLEEDHLPNFKKIMDEGAYGPMKTIVPTGSIIIWTSVITGKHHRQHGIIGFTYYYLPGISRALHTGGTILEIVLIPLRRKKVVEVAPYTVKYRKCKAIWNIIALRGHTVGIMNWMGSKKRGGLEDVNGFIISDHFRIGLMDDPPPQSIKPDSIYDEVIEFNTMPVYDSLPQFVKELDTEIPGLDEFISGLESVERKVNLTLSLAEKFNPDIIFFYDHFLDSIQHRFWRFMEPDHYQEKIPADQVELYGKTIDYTYIYFDRVVKRLIEGTGGDRDVMILSDHGMEPGPLFLKGSSKRMVKDTDLLLHTISAHHDMAPPGIFIAKGEGVKKGVHVLNTSIYDITPTLLYMFEFPIASDMKGRVLDEIFEESYLASHPQSIIPTYETREVSEEKRIPLVETDKKTLEDLKALGYVR